jgi:hypothetical protein
MSVLFALVRETYSLSLRKSFVNKSWLGIGLESRWQGGWRTLITNLHTQEYTKRNTNHIIQAIFKQHFPNLI